MDQDKIINIQGRTIIDFTGVVIAAGNTQALTDWRARLLQCAAQVELAIKKAKEQPPEDDTHKLA
jgi:hypothetical protein